MHTGTVHLHIPPAETKQRAKKKTFSFIYITDFGCSVVMNLCALTIHDFFYTELTIEKIEKWIPKFPKVSNVKNSLSEFVWGPVRTVVARRYLGRAANKFLFVFGGERQARQTAERVRRTFAARGERIEVGAATRPSEKH